MRPHLSIFSFEVDLKASLIRLFIFFLPLLLVMAFVEYRLYQTPTRYSALAQIMDLNSENTEVLIFGSSHGVYNYQPVLFPKPTVNFSNVSQSHEVDIRLLEKYLDQMPKLEKVIFNVSMFSLGYRMLATQYSDRAKFYRQHFGFWGDGEWYQHLSLKDRLMTLTYPIQDLREEFRWFEEIQLSEPVDNWGGFDQRFSRVKNDRIDALSGKGRADHHYDLYRDEYRQEILAKLKRVAMELAANRIEVHFVIPPAFPTYTYHFSAKWQMDIVRDLEATGAKVHNYFLDSQFVEEDYYNNDHLNFEGSKKFTRVIIRDLNI